MLGHSLHVSGSGNTPPQAGQPRRVSDIPLIPRALPEPREQRWLRDGDRGQGQLTFPSGMGIGDRDSSPSPQGWGQGTGSLPFQGQALLLPSDPRPSQGCSPSLPLSRQFHPGCRHAPGKANPNSGSFGQPAASPERIFRRGGNRLGGRGSNPAPPAGAPSGTSGTRPGPVRYRHRSVPGALSPPQRSPESPAVLLQHRSPHPPLLHGANSNDTKEKTNPTVFCADPPGC